VAAAGIVGLTAGLAMVGLRGRPQAPSPPPAKAAAMAPIEVASSPVVTLPVKPAGPIPVLDTAPVRKAAAPRHGHAVSGRRANASDLIAADRRLRVAYAHAVRAGVPRHVLVSYRNRWADLRNDANWRPAQVVAGYGEMSADLERMAQRPNNRPAVGRFSLYDFRS
jgi:hypothetical protein